MINPKLSFSVTLTQEQYTALRTFIDSEEYAVTDDSVYDIAKDLWDVKISTSETQCGSLAFVELYNWVVWTLS